MREIEILHAPGGFGIRGMGLSSPEAFPEEHQFKPEPFAARGGHITRVIPPFRAKVLMLEVIPRKLISIARQGIAILEGAAQKWEKTERKCQRPQRPAYRNSLLPWGCKLDC